MRSLGCGAVLSAFAMGKRGFLGVCRKAAVFCQHLPAKPESRMHAQMLLLYRPTPHLYNAPKLNLKTTVFDENSFVSNQNSFNLS
jgi:hypothetical protein